MRKSFLFILYFVIHKILFCLPVIIWMESDSFVHGYDLPGYIPSPGIFSFYVGLFILSIFLPISKIIIPNDDVASKRREITITSIGIILGICIILFKIMFKEYNLFFLLMFSLFTTILAIVWIYSRILGRKYRVLEHCLSQWHEEWKNSEILINKYNNKKNYKKYPLIISITLLTVYFVSISYMYIHMGKTWQVIAGFLLSYGSLIALIQRLGSGLGPSHPWYPPYWRSSLVIGTVITITFGYWFTHQTHLPFLQEYLWRNFPYLFTDWPPILSQIFAVPIILPLSYVWPGFAHVLTKKS
ncbi:hypothetical protein [Pasteuria penetrans]|uniref:hypothetical protein n=1 Tax=Pasteuria penetrans TaxID=86005 RepID=UPI000FB01672|nr:hypothetical protein [Pasteuria penetrans]